MWADKFTLIEYQNLTEVKCRLQDSIYELLATESSYLKDLQLTIEVYHQLILFF